jgi:RNA polymerase subunit RPABC4/transcription elongation factor Spt4
MRITIKECTKCKESCGVDKKRCPECGSMKVKEVKRVV